MRIDDAETEIARATNEPPTVYPGTLKIACAAQRVALAGLALYAVFAPHSIAGAWIGLSIAILGWLIRTTTFRHDSFAESNDPSSDFIRSRLSRFIRQRLNIHPTPLALPLWLFFAWSVVAAFFSAEPHVSLPKLASVSTFLIFYLVQSVVTRRTAIPLAALLIASGVAGALWSAGETARGRGVCIETIVGDSPLIAATELRPGDCVWRVNRRRVASVDEIDEIIRGTPPGQSLSLSVITRGEHAEWIGPLVTPEMQAAASPSGLTGTRPTRRFRASGWTRHYATFAEALQILAQLALGFTLAYFSRRAARRRVLLCAAAFTLLAVGLALTSMRTTLVAFTVGALVSAWRAAGPAKRARLAIVCAVACALVCGALIVNYTRASGALQLQDASSRLRAQVARAALRRIPERPLFGHGMDAVKFHWREWNFPGDIMIHTHSTPLQLAFERGLPALALWLWLLASIWLFLTRAEKIWRASTDAGAHGFLVGATGAFAGFAASSLVNYNLGDAETALLIWWLLGTAVAIVNDKKLKEAIT